MAKVHVQALLRGGDITAAQVMALVTNGRAAEGAAAFDHDAVIDVVEAVCRYLPDDAPTRGVAALRVMAKAYGVAYDAADSRPRLCAKVLKHVDDKSIYRDFATDREEPGAKPGDAIYSDFTRGDVTGMVWEAIGKARTVMTTEPVVAMLAADSSLTYKDMLTSPQHPGKLGWTALMLALIRVDTAMFSLLAAADAAKTAGSSVGRLRALVVYALLADVRKRVEQWVEEAHEAYATKRSDLLTETARAAAAELAAARASARKL